MPEVLVIKPSSFGDIVHGLLVIETLRRRLPGARISWIAARAFAPLVRACATVDEVFEFDRKGGVRGFFRLMCEVRRRRYDLVLDLQGLARSALMAVGARGARTLGRSDAREGARWLVRERFPLPPGGGPAHAVDILRQVLPALGLDAALEGALHFSTPAGSRVLEALPAGTGPLVVMFPESRRPEKNWPGFGALTRLLLERRPEVRIVWDTSNRALEDAPAEGPRFANWIGRTRIDELPALVQAADWVVANDSGPMHLAAAVGTRVLAVFGPTDPRLFGPYPPGDDRHRVVRAPNGDLTRLEPEAVAEVMANAGAGEAQPK